MSLIELRKPRVAYRGHPPEHQVSGVFDPGSPIAIAAQSHSAEGAVVQALSLGQHRQHAALYRLRGAELSRPMCQTRPLALAQPTAADITTKAPLRPCSPFHPGGIHA
ncbi:hypothetical protein [Paucibacter sp. KBW04]|uniref:hypothetical protein n=1 Tax=Paucibacter sp. KBW04 TaxID=2153361 RepID=UPI000F56DA4D|nr:hypothetical protein [Paucibacter sp. KBW04]